MHFPGRKLFHLMVVVLAVSFLTFLMVDLLPGNAAYTVAGFEGTPEEILALQEDLGLTGNVFARFLGWLSSAVSGDLGLSSITGEPVLETILSRLPVTIELMLLSQIFALLLAVPAALISSYRQQTFFDTFLTGFAFTALSVPVFVMALILIYIFAVWLNWFPATGYVSLNENAVHNLRSFALPALSIALVEWVPLMRVLRSDLITTLQKDYILLARAKGLPASRILLSHALRPSSFSLITILGLHIGHLIGGALIVESIFALPGIGRLLVGAILNQDADLVQGCILFIAIAYVMINFMIDVLYKVIDPRLRRGTGHVRL